MRIRHLALVAAVPVAVGAAIVATPGHVHAAGNTLAVQTTTDDDGSATCTGTAPNLSCPTLRDAVVRADTDNSNDTIALGSTTYVLSNCSGIDVFGPFPGSDGALAVSSSMTVQGQGSGATLIDTTSGTCGASTGWNDPIFATCSSPDLTMIGVTLEHGNASGVGPSGLSDGGAINVGEVTSCPPRPDAPQHGTQPIPASPGTLTMQDVKIANSSSAGDGGGAAAGEGTIPYNVSFSSVTFASNKANGGEGGAFYFDSTSVGSPIVTMNNVWAHDNAQTVTECATQNATRSGKACPTQIGGGAFYILDSSNQTSTATNVLIERNTANSINGGGVYESGTAVFNWT
ncbi:MAG: hypothetical protein JOY80_08425, partial [Candidatus Dormibacteraeota bacterium]|nr:hypothetical protein [Candidatus Dormibacteraeota bacterium]